MRECTQVVVLTAPPLNGFRGPPPSEGRYQCCLCTPGLTGQLPSSHRNTRGDITADQRHVPMIRLAGIIKVFAGLDRVATSTPGFPTLSNSRNASQGSLII